LLASVEYPQILFINIVFLTWIG